MSLLKQQLSQAQAQPAKSELEYKKEVTARMIAANKAAARTLLLQTLSQLDSATPISSVKSKREWI